MDTIVVLVKGWKFGDKTAIHEIHNYKQKLMQKDTSEII